MIHDAEEYDVAGVFVLPADVLNSCALFRSVDEDEGDCDRHE